MDPDPHSSYFLDPDPHSICGSESRKENVLNKNRNKARKLLITASLFLKKLSKFAQSSIVSYFRVIFYVFYEELWIRIHFTFVTIFFKNISRKKTRKLLKTAILFNLKKIRTKLLCF